MGKCEPLGRDAWFLCQGDLFPALTGHLFSGEQMDFPPLGAQFQQTGERESVILMASDRSSLECALS